MIRKSLIAATAVLFAVALVIVVSPLAVRSIVERQLIALGAESVSIGNIELNLIAGTATVSGLRAEREGAAPVVIGKAAIQLAYLPLFRRRIVIERLKVDRIGSEIVVGDDGAVRIGPFTFPAGGVEDEPGKAHPWHIGLAGFEASRIDVSLVTPSLVLKTTLDRLSLDRFQSWRPTEKTTIRLSGRVNGGGVSISAKAAPLADSPSAEGTITIKGLPLERFAALAEPAVSSLKGALDAELSFSYRKQPGGKGAGGRIEGDVTIAGAAASVLASGGGVEIETASMTLEKVRIAYPPAVAIGAIRAEGLKADILKRPGEVAEQAPNERTKRKADEPPFEWRIETLVIGKGSRIHFTDETVEPPYTSEIDVTEAVISGLTGGAPSRRAAVSFLGTLDHFAAVTVKGDVAPFGPAPGLDIRATVTGMDLPPFNSYAVKEIGYRITTGQMDADITMKIEGGVIDGLGDIVIRKLDVKPADKKAIERFSTRLSMPLKTALQSLRDRKGTIRLSVPVTGSLDDPSFDFGDAVNTALGKTLQRTAVTYLKITIQPYGAMVATAQFLGRLVKKFMFKPVFFPPGSAAPDKDMDAYFEKLTTLLDERPGLSLTLCGVAVPADREALATAAQEAAKKEAPPIKDEALVALARERSLHVKERLVTERGIAGGRLIICEPVFRDKPKKRGRVELSF